uniref:Cocaine- and amphetamine-regulated transcript protein n=1 Tax=Neogobius melanostomus TaxID=47308 RepID=A0A8C6WRN5_9GOBI
MTRCCPLLLSLTLLLSLGLGRTWAQTDQSREDPDSEPELGLGRQQDLVEALEVLLGQMHSVDKRGSIPTCGMGDRCAMKFGPRIGKLCDCGRGANCNSFLLKCI